MINGTGPYQTGISDLQVFLSDQPDDRYVYQAKCFGLVNGVNTAFKTFYRRRATNFTTGLSGGIYIDGSLVAASGVMSDNQETGEFVLVAAPSEGVSVDASYYYQWFDVSELDTFLQIAGNWLQSNPDYTQTGNQFIDALIKYAASQAYGKLAQRWRTYMSQEYKVEDAPKDSPTYNTNEFLQLAKYYRAEALASRTEYMQTRQGRALQPLFANITGRIRNIP